MKNLNQVYDNLNNVFEFKIGDIVQHKIQSAQYGEHRKSTKMLIICRSIEEDTAGIQRYYTCRMELHVMHPTTIEPTKLYNFNEIELEKIK